MQNSDRVYKMSEEARAKNREWQRNFRKRRKLAAGQIIALEATSSEVATPVSTEGESSIPDASTQAGNA